MERRKFLTSSIGASALAIIGMAAAQTPEENARQFYQLRRYSLVSGPQGKLTENFVRDALIPAAKRMGLGPVGAFRLEYGEQTPQFYVLIPGSSIATVAELDLRLAEDAAFLESAAPYWNPGAGAPAFQRVEISLLAAFKGWPRITPPGASGKRIFQLRSYESPSNFDHVRKIEMFHSGEFEIFRKSGCGPVFFSDVLAGPRLPKLTYMLSFADTAELEAGWEKFRNDPDWKKLEADPRFSFAPIVTNITNLILSPLDCSQI
ncbi:MAG: NIPSNAP family protein [Terracidiphilus sp.]